MNEHDEQIDSAFAEGVRACLQRLYAANVRTDKHQAAWEDCEALWRTRFDQVIASRIARKRAPVPLPTTLVTRSTLDQISAKAREWAGHYPQSSDGRNTFILFAEWVESLSPSVPDATDLVKALAIFLGGDERFQVAVGGNPNAVDKMLESAREVLARASQCLAE